MLRDRDRGGRWRCGMDVRMGRTRAASAGRRCANGAGSTEPPVGCIALGRRRGGIRWGGARAVARAVVRAACLITLTATIGFAGEASEPGSSAVQPGVGVLAATGLGSMSTDLNGHPGFGFAVRGYVPVASRLELRPAFEWTGYRVNEYNLAALLLTELLGASYEDTRVVFRTYRLGLDGVVYLRKRYTGPFLSGGVGVQLSQVYIEDVVHYGDGKEDVTPLHASSATTGLWLGGGVGYQWAGSNVELRLSRAPYGFTGQRPANRNGNTLPFEARPGWALHLMFGVRSRAAKPTPAPTTE